MEPLGEGGVGLVGEGLHERRGGSNNAQCHFCTAL